LSEHKSCIHNQPEEFEFIQDGELTLQELYEVLDILAENLISRNIREQGDEISFNQEG
jgi:hypothetical protein